ncbi:MAG: iron ABC transporter substrate-binding protein [Clostridia bacterium]|nr:iron ABC transporter substrate-binding protein [Clostridia bacterium]
MKTVYKIASVMLVIILLFSGCSNLSAESSPDTAEATTRTIADVLGREVEIPTQIDSIICTGPGALRLVCYAQAQDLVTGVEDVDKTTLNTIKCPYGYVFNEVFKDLPSIGKGGGRSNTAYDEEIIVLQPDVILTAYSSDAVEELQQKTCIPVVCITQYEGNFFGDDLEASFTLIGDILGKQERCAELVSYMEQAQADLNDRTKDVADADKLRAYAGAVTFGGGHGIEGTYANFGPFTAINATNVADETCEKSYFIVDLERIVTWDPDVIFLDPANMELVNEEYSNNPDYFNSLSAVQAGEVYSMPSYIWYNTNLEMGIADTYYAGMVLFPEQFADIDIEAKTDEILEMFLGKALYSEMEKAGLGFGKITIGE